MMFNESNLHCDPNGAPVRAWYIQHDAYFEKGLSLLEARERINALNRIYVKGFEEGVRGACQKIMEELV